MMEKIAIPNGTCHPQVVNHGAGDSSSCVYLLAHDACFRKLVVTSLV